MKKPVVLLIVLGISLSFDANAWFFFFIPGNVTSSISDAITGDEGRHCIGQQAKVGDLVRTANGVMRVKSVSGVSMRCADSNIQCAPCSNRLD